MLTPENGALTGVRSTHGVLGPTRADNKFLPGDSVLICFDIEGSCSIEVTEDDVVITQQLEPEQ